MNFIKEGAIISCYLDAAAILAMLLLLVLSERLRQRKTPSYERFYRFAATVLATCVICLVYNAMYMQPAPWCRRVALVSRTLREYAVMLVVLQWSAYVYRKLYGEVALRPVVRGAFLLPAAVFAALTSILAKIGIEGVNTFSTLYRPSSSSGSTTERPPGRACSGSCRWSYS